MKRIRAIKKNTVPKRTNRSIGGPLTNKKWQSTVELRAFKEKAKNSKHFDNINEFRALKERLQQLDNSLNEFRARPMEGRRNTKFYLSPEERQMRYDITRTRSRISYLSTVLPPEILSKLENAKTGKKTKTG